MSEKYDVNAMSDRELCGLVADMAQRIEAHVRKAAELLGLTTSQAIALRELNEPLTLSELAKRMCCEAPNATFVADRLEKLGYLKRVPHEVDRRSKQLILTTEGTAVRNNLLGMLVIDSPLGSLSKAEQLALKALLTTAVTHPASK